MTYMFKRMHYCLQIYLKTLEINVLKYMNLILYILCLHQDQHGKLVLKMTGVKLELITDYDMLLMIEKRIRSGICQPIHSYAKANNKYIKNYDKNNESSYIEYLEVNNLYGWAMSQKLPVNGFK